MSNCGTVQCISVVRGTTNVPWENEHVYCLPIGVKDETIEDGKNALCIESGGSKQHKIVNGWNGSIILLQLTSGLD